MSDAHTHWHGGGPAPHSHGASGSTDARRLAIAFGLILLLMAGEVVAGILASSLSLLSDAVHMLTDAAALGLSLVAVRLARRPARGAMTYGFKRVEILSAQFNGATLLVLALVIVYEGIYRLIFPPGVTGTVVLIVALVGVAVNLAATWTLSGASRQSMNIEGAFQHILTDLFAFIATAAAGAVIIATGFNRADAIASLVIAVVMLRAAFGLLRDSGRVFLEAAPQGVDPDAIGRAMASEPGVTEVHDLHVWEVTSGFPALSAHVLVGEENDCHQVSHTLKRLLHDKFGIEHTTLQVDHEHTQLLTIETEGQVKRTTETRHRSPGEGS